MNRRTLLLVLALFAAALAPTSRAQQSDPTAQNPPPAQAVAPAPSQDATSPPPKAPAQKKVWTDEDVKSLHTTGGISTSQPANPAPDKLSEKSNAKPAAPANGKNSRWYQDQIARLKEKLPPLDEQIEKLQATLDGKTVDETRHYGAKIDDWRDELARLQKKRDEITARIAALQDEARHNGVPVNVIP